MKILRYLFLDSTARYVWSLWASVAFGLLFFAVGVVKMMTVGWSFAFAGLGLILLANGLFSLRVRALLKRRARGRRVMINRKDRSDATDPAMFDRRSQLKELPCGRGALSSSAVMTR